MSSSYQQPLYKPREIIITKTKGANCVSTKRVKYFYKPSLKNNNKEKKLNLFITNDYNNFTLNTEEYCITIYFLLLLDH